MKYTEDGKGKAFDTRTWQCFLFDNPEDAISLEQSIQSLINLEDKIRKLKEKGQDITIYDSK